MIIAQHPMQFSYVPSRNIKNFLNHMFTQEKKKIQPGFFFLWFLLLHKYRWMGIDSYIDRKIDI